MVALNDLLALSPHDEEAFIQFEALCRERMNHWVGNLDDRESPDQARLEYMSRVQAAAAEYEVDGAENLGDPAQTLSPESFHWFNQEVLKLITRLQIRAARRAIGASVELEPADRTKLKAEIERFRNRVSAADGIERERKSALLKKVDELLREIDRPTLNLTRFTLIMAAITSVFTAIGTAESSLIKGPETVVAVLDIVHMINGKNEERKALLEHYRKPRAIEDKREKPPYKSMPQSRVSDFSADLDDEIPF